MHRYLQAPHYKAVLQQVGFTDADFSAVSDRLVDAIVCWGPEAKLRERIAAHYQADPSHVYILPLSEQGTTVPDERVLEVLAPR
jgi:hypothetical protein